MALVLEAGCLFFLVFTPGDAHPFAASFIRRRPDSIGASLRLTRFDDQSKKVALLTNRESFKILHSPIFPQNTHQVIRDGSFSRTIANGDLYAHPISFCYVYRFANFVLNPKLVSSFPDRIETGYESLRLVDACGDRDWASRF